MNKLCVLRPPRSATTWRHYGLWPMTRDEHLEDLKKMLLLHFGVADDTLWTQLPFATPPDC